MTLRYMVDKIEEVDEGLRPLYRENAGKFVLDVDGVVPKARVDEFRDNNLSLRQQIEEMTRKFDGIDPVAARELTEKAQKERDKKLIDAGKVEDLLAQRVGTMKDDYESRLKAISTERDRLTTQMEGFVIDNALRDSAARAGVRTTALEDVLLRGRRVFRLQDGKAVPMEGDRPIYGKGGDMMSIDEWVSALTGAAPHLFEASSGAGTRGATAAPGNPGGAINRTDPAAFLSNLDAIASNTRRVA